MNPQTEFSVGQNIKKLYKEIFKEIFPQIKNQKKGVLIAVIHILENESQAQEICNYFNIKPNASLEDELLISLDIIGVFLSNPTEKNTGINDQIFQFAKELRKNVGSNWEPNQMKLFQIVVIGCMIVGAAVCIKYLEKVKKEREREVRGSREIQSSNSYSPPPKKPVPVALCLVVPASVVGNLRNNNPINVSDIENLIDNSLYFLCTTPQEANANKPHIETTNEDITNVSEQREIYVRIDIADGEEMIGKKVPYILKRNLPSNGQGVVKELDCLKYLSVSGLENFNRI